MKRNINNYTNSYCHKDYDFEKKYQVFYRRRNILELLSYYKHNSILEVGCALEPLFKYIDMKDIDTYVIVEPSKTFYENAKKIANDKIEIYNDYIENINLNIKFDYIIISGLLHEVPNPEETLKTIKNFMNNDTIIYINVPNAKSFHRLLAYESSLINSIYEKSDTQKILQQFYTFDIQSMRNLLESLDFEVLKTGSYFLKPFSHKQMKNLVDNKIINDQILDGLHKMIKYFPEFGSEIYLICKNLK